MSRSADGEALEGGLLASLTHLISRWSSSDLQRRVAHGVGIELDATEVRAIYTLGLRGGSARPSELADELHLTRPTASKLLARLVADGLVEKSDDPRDGRASVVALSATGARAYGELARAGREMIAHALADWDAREAEAFGALLRRFVQGLIAESAMSPDAAQPRPPAHDGGEQQPDAVG
ncbi:MarR family transcriptional regulator [Agromyces sp. SYSU K20354]|uniref:MarR family winged helix-turn-helix transcriptional regulator n=1 Tax=Agromyces cavernae TaxID=2898659 RepID=UPI001E290F14|nr:MarR family transcriptional regulator [Agromyces cavernae]MCD2443660.1 MarR family transcriptional regulator [Agromyces cavernae]